MKKRIVLIILTVLWMGVIFLFSSENSEISGEKSGRLTTLVQRIAYPDWSDLSEEEYRYQMAGLSFLVRKAGHFTEFLILGALVITLASTFKISAVFRVIIAVLFCALYAFSDELHQFFVAGRDMRVFDMGIDTIGAAFGALIFRKTVK